MYQPNYYTLTFLIRSARANRSGEAPILQESRLQDKELSSMSTAMSLPKTGMRQKEWQKAVPKRTWS